MQTFQNLFFNSKYFLVHFINQVIILKEHLIKDNQEALIDYYSLIIINDFIFI